MDWDKVFTTGKHTDGNGNTKNWTTADLDRIVNLFNPTFHEPPLVIGHPSDNAPAFGWIEAIKRVGNDLMVKYRDVAAEFQEWVDKGFYKKKSIAIYPDGSLRHVGYLGAMPPAIKGLPDFQFADSDRGAPVTYEFGDWADQCNASMWRRLRDFFIAQFGLDTADKVLPDYNVATLEQDANKPDDQGAMPETLFNQHTKEDDMNKEEVVVLIDEALKGQAEKFSEQLKGISESIKGISTQFSELQKGQTQDREANLRREFSEFLAAPEMQKRIAEGSRPATIAHMMTLVGAEPVEFGEGDQKVKVSALDNYKKQLQALPEVVVFGETATKDKVGDTTVNGMDAQTLSSKAVEFQESEAKAGRTISMTEAVNHVKKGGK